MSGETGHEDDTLIEMFRAEVETHAETLSSALLALERQPGDTSRIDEMMRAAHSIKGASRVVGVDPAVSVAHVMEDCFVAAQKGTLALSPRDVDVLLRGVDLLGRISTATKDPDLDLNREFDQLVDAQVAELQGVLSGRPGPVEPAPASVAVSEASRPIGEPSDRQEAPQAGASLPTPDVPDITITFPEYLDSVAAEELRQQLLVAIADPSRAISLDLHATRDLDADGLAFLAAIPPHLARSGRPAPELARVSPELATVLRVTGLAGSFGARREAAWRAE